jgi:BASS family bile acid:Na+ symporter
MGPLNGRLIAGWLLAGTITAGFALPGLSAYFAPFALPALFCMIVASLVPMGRLRLEEVFSLEPDILRIVAWQLLVLPTIILAASHLARLNLSLVTLLAVTACAGSLFASPALADLLGLNQRKALQCMVLSTFLMPFSYFFFLTAVLHSEVDIVIADFVGRSGIFLMLPAALFLFYSAYAEDLPDRVVANLERSARFVTIAALMIFGLGIVGPACDMLWSQPARFAGLLLMVTALGAGMAFLTTIVMYRQGITNALTASIVSGFRNVGLGFVLIEGSATPDTAAYVGISQIPIFLAPLIMRMFVASSAAEEEDGGAQQGGAVPLRAA